jgi:tetratricopeptide (TPR) repeat protein
VKPSTDVNKQQVITLLQSNQAQRARELCVKLAGATPDPHVRVLLANAQIQLGELDDACSSLRKAVDGGWMDPGALVMLAALSITRDKPVDAESWYAKFARQAPHARVQLARALRRLNNHAAAFDQYRRALDENPRDPDACFEFAEFLHRNGKADEAVRWYERGLDIRPDSENIQARINLAVCLNGMKQFDRAVAVLTQAAAIAPTNPAVLFHLGENYQQQNRYHMAVDSYRQALEQAPDAAALYGSLARAQRSLGDLEAALANLERARKLEPGNATIHHDMGICLFRDDDLQPALKAFTEAVRLNPGNALSRVYLGLVLALTGSEADAEEQFSQACRLWPYVEAFVDSYRYAARSAPAARWFCTGRQMFEHAVGKAGAEGLFLEFGVYFGTSINIIARLTGNPVHGFDTFQGLPIDWVVNNEGREEVEAAGSYSTHGRLPEAPDNVQFHVGTFEQTLPGFCETHPGPVSFMNVDCDLYESTRTIFTSLRDRVRSGTVIVFDEYFCLSGWRDHEYRAFQEFLRETGLGYEYLAFNFFTGQAAVRIT